MKIQNKILIFLIIWYIPGNTSRISGFVAWIHPFLCCIMHWNIFSIVFSLFFEICKIYIQSCNYVLFVCSWFSKIGRWETKRTGNSLLFIRVVGVNWKVDRRIRLMNTSTNYLVVNHNTCYIWANICWSSDNNIGWVEIFWDIFTFNASDFMVHSWFISVSIIEFDIFTILHIPSLLWHSRNDAA